MELEELTDEQQERMCEICQDCIFGYKVNTGYHNLCEGSRCEDALEYFMEEFNEEKREKRKYLLIN